MLLGIIPLLLVGLGLTFLLDSDDDDTAPEEDSGELTLTPGNDMLDMADTGATTVNALAGDDTITSTETDAILLRLGPGADTAELSNGFAEVHGREGDDSITMTDGSLLAYLGLGNDTVEVIDGQAEAYGGGGNDLMIASQYDDTLDGGSGFDTLYGGDGDDRLLGGFGDDEIYGETGDDVLSGGQGNDTLIDLDGNDLLVGNNGNDSLETDGRGDTLYGYTGDDTLTAYAFSALQDNDPGAVLDGGVGNDDLTGDLNTTMTGGEGQDDFTVVSEFGSPDAPALITDFDPSENDRIFLTITPETYGDPRDGVDYVVTRQVAADDSGVEILVNGEVYAKLEGITTLDGWTVNVLENVI